MEPDPATAAARATAMVDTPPEAEVDADGGARAETPTAKGPPTCGDGARAATPAADAAAPPAAGRDDDGLPPPPPLSSQSRVLTPPTSEDMGKCDESSSELSELDMDVGREEADDEDIGDIEPDHYWDDGKIPVFKPTMRQFRDFERFIARVDKYGMRSGIVKVIPPPEWRESLPNLAEMVKTIRVKNPITQEFAGTHGTYTQANIEKQRSYSLPQWKSLTEESNHQPPARRGERRKAPAPPPKPKTPKPVRTASPRPESGSLPIKRGRGRPRKHPLRVEVESPQPEPQESPSQPSTESEPQLPDQHPQSAVVPPTPTSPATRTEQEVEVKDEQADAEEAPQDTTPAPASEPIKRGRGRPRKSDQSSAAAKPAPRVRVKAEPKSKDTVTSVTSRRMHNKREQFDVDEAAFEGFDYHLGDADQFTPDRCRELEEVYWRTINYGTPMYGADMPGSLFKDDTSCWNVAKLPNLLDVLGTNVPGVNTAYLYLGMWKATFAWHLEDVDLYSINYIHFGAPKQWYSVSQEDARRFEAAMQTIWPNDAKHCDQFLRHKTYLISPEKLKTQFGIKVNKLVHYEGEFVITYPYGYHSGFNLGYNCAESVNFATASWLDYGRIAKKCNCESDSVWVDVYEIERKLRGEPTPEFMEITDDELDYPGDYLPSPAASHTGKRGRPPKRKRDEKAKDPGREKKKIKVRIKTAAHQPCILCPNEAAYDQLLPTDNGKLAHRLCAIYTPETYIAGDEGNVKVYNVAGIDKARLELRCIYCRAKHGSVFQCSSKKCARAYHATCAAPGGVQIDTGPVPTWGEDGTEYVCEGYDFRCRFHRPKRPRGSDSESLEKNTLVVEYGKALGPGEVVQAQYLDGDIFAGVVVENRPDETSCIVDVLPDGDRVEVEWKWLLVLDPADSERPKPSPDALPLPEHLLKSEVSKNNRQDGVPEEGDPFHDPIAEQKWAYFHAATSKEICNPDQVQVDFCRENQVWHYLGKHSTEAKAQYTEDLRVRQHNPKSNFLDLVQPSRAEKARLRQEARQKKAQADKEFRFQPKVLTAMAYNQHAYGPGHALAPKPLTPFPGVQNLGAAGFQLTQTMPGYAAYARNMPVQPPAAYAPPHQDLLNDRAASQFVRASPDQRYHQHQHQQSPVARLDNSPRYQNYYTKAESRYTTQQAQEYHRRYQALAAATQLQQQRQNASPTPPAAAPYEGNTFVAPPPPAVLRPSPAGLEADPNRRQLPQQMQVEYDVGVKRESGDDGVHFTPPSLRPEMRAAAAAAAAAVAAPTVPGGTPLLQAFRFNAPGRGGTANAVAVAATGPGARDVVGQSREAAAAAAAAAAGYFQTSEQFSASVGDAASRLGRGRFEAMMRRLGEVGAGASCADFEDGARTPPGRPMSPVRPEFSPLSDA